MALQSSGQISIADINVELGLPSTTQSDLGQANFRALAGISSGAIGLSDFYGKSAVAYGYYAFGAAPTYIKKDNSNNFYYYIGGYVVKTNAAGTILWQVTVGGGVWTCMDVNVSTGEVHLGGYWLVSGSNYGLAVCKLTASGAFSWARRYDSTSIAWENYQAIFVNTAGDVFLTGISNTSNSNIIVTKVDSAGTFQWHRVLTGATVESGFSVVADTAGNVYVAATTNSGGGLGANDTLLVCYNSVGTLQWQRSFGTTGGDFNPGITIDSSNNIYISCSVNTSQLVAKFAASTTAPTSFIWQKTLNFVAYERPGFDFAPDGTLYIGVNYNYNGTYVGAFDTNGNLIRDWTFTYNSSNSVTGFIVESNSAFLVAYSSFQDLGHPFGIVTDGAGFIRFPTNGSKLGTYSAAPFFAADPSLTVTTSSFTFTTRTLTGTTPSLTATNMTATVTTTNISFTMTGI